MRPRNPRRDRPVGGGWKLRRRAAAFFLLSLGIGNHGLADGITSGPDPSELVRKARPALVLLVSLDRYEKAKSFGTGFFISQEGILVTARHVAQAEGNLVALLQDGKKLPVTGFIGEDRDYDIAVLKIERSECPHLRLANGMPKTNQPVALVSAPASGLQHRHCGGSNQPAGSLRDFSNHSPGAGRPKRFTIIEC